MKEEDLSDGGVAFMRLNLITIFIFFFFEFSLI